MTALASTGRNAIGACMTNRFIPRQAYGDQAIKTYLDAMSNLSANTFRCANDRLTLLPRFVKAKYSMTVDKLFEAIKAGQHDRYNVLSAFTGWLKHDEKKTDNRVRTLVKTLRQLMEFNDIEVSQRTFTLKVRLPRKITRIKEPVSIQEIRAVLQSAKDVKLRTFLMTLAATGVRPIEAASILHKHIDLQSNPPRITIRAEFTKMRVERYVYLTVELAKQISLYLDYKLRQRYQEVTQKDGSVKATKITPELRSNDLLFAPYRRDGRAPSVNSIYIRLLINTEQLLDTINMNERIGNGDVRKFHFYSMRRFAKSTVSDMGYGDFSEWMLGHSGSPYYERSEKDRAEVWRKVEGALMFLDMEAIETKQKDIESMLERSEQELAKVKQKLADKDMEVKAMIAAEVEKQAMRWVQIKAGAKQLRESYKKKDST